MKILTKYYGSMKLDVFNIGNRYRYVLRKKDGQALLKPVEYEVSLPICLFRVEQWIMDNGHDIYG